MKEHEVARQSKKHDRAAAGSPERVVREFVRRINRRDVEALARLMTVRHVLIDSLGHRIEGDGKVSEAWAGYFRMVPDYRIRPNVVLVRRNVVFVVGVAGGSYQPPFSRSSIGAWSTPATWRAVVRRQRVAEWQVYADNEPIRQLMRQASDEAGRTQARNLGIAARYLACLSEGAGPEELESFLAPDVVQEEFPNRLLPDGATRDLQAMKEGRMRGKALMKAETYELLNAVARDHHVAMEVAWRGTVREAAGPFEAGQRLRARFALFMEFQDGRIVRQRNYDCFDA